MHSRRRKILQRHQAEYLRRGILSGSPIRIKQILQQIYAYYRNGAVFSEQERKEMENVVLGTLVAGNSDEKIRRWALVVLACIGRKEVSCKAVTQILYDYPNEPQTLAAAIATIFKFDGPSAQHFLIDKNLFHPELIVLAGLQTVNQSQIDTSKIKINIEKSENNLIKLALLLIGLNKAPEHIFDPKYTNAKIIKELGNHHDPMISQYSVWAASENKYLGINDIGINIKNIDDYPPNVRAYTYRMFAEDKIISLQRHQIIDQGSQDLEAESRLGLAIGLRNSYFDGLEGITVNWFYDEKNEDIKFYVLDHIIAQSTGKKFYENIALEQFDYYQ